MLLAEQIKKKWQPVLDLEEGYSPIKSSYKRQVIAQVLESTEDLLRSEGQTGFGPGALTEAAPNVAGSGLYFGGNAATSSVAGYDPVLISLIRRSLPNLISFDVMGVQPLNSPSGLIFALRSYYSTQGGTEALFNEAATAFSGTGTQAGTEPMPQSDLNTYKPGTATTTALGEAWGDGGGTNFNQMAFGIDRVQVIAKTRGLKAEYTIELQQDLKAVHGLDAETELANILSTEILTEINRECVRTIYNNAVLGAANATTPGTFDLDVDAQGRWLLERIKGLMFQLEIEANAIAKATRRGRGNIILCSSNVASALSIAGLIDNSKLVDNLSHGGDVENTFVGVLNGRFKVFVDPYPTDTVAYAVVGYRGANAYDCGLFYCPYVPLQMLRAVGPDSFQPRIGFKTRYGLVANPFATSAGTGNLSWRQNIYYRIMQISNLY